MNCKVLWVCVVWERDAEKLCEHVPEVFKQAVPPTEMLIVNSGDSKAIDACVAKLGNCVQAKLAENLGFNPGLNEAIDWAVKGNFDWLAMMTVRATPKESWLHEALQAAKAADVGMVSTLHLDAKGEKVDCLGHHLSPSGAAYSFGRGLRQEQIEDLMATPGTGEPIWSPCSGGAIYRVTALREALGIFNCELVRPRGFKSYNCDVIGYAVRAAGYRHQVALKAICRRDRSASTSENPNSMGLLMNQEINRVANLFEFWEKDRCEAAAQQYLFERRKTPLSANDRVIARTLGEGLARRPQLVAVRQRVAEQLGQHIGLFAPIKQRWKHLLETQRDKNAHAD